MGAARCSVTVRNGELTPIFVGWECAHKYAAGPIDEPERYTDSGMQNLLLETIVGVSNTKRKSKIHQEQV
jgi:hypothetical protein